MYLVLKDVKNLGKRENLLYSRLGEQHKLRYPSMKKNREQRHWLVCGVFWTE